MAQCAPVLILPPQNRRPSLSSPHSRQKPVATLPHKVRGAECITWAAANLNAGEGWMCADFRKEIEDFAAVRRGAGVVEGGWHGDCGGSRCEADGAGCQRWAERCE